MHKILTAGLIAFVCLLPVASAQTFDRSQLGGRYSGRAQEQGGGPRWTDMAITLTKPSNDGRFTGSIQAFRAGPQCGRPLPASGEILTDGSVRMEIKAGGDVPSGCERTYDLKLVGDNRLTGTAVFGGNKFDLDLKKVGD